MASWTRSQGCACGYMPGASVTQAIVAALGIGPADRAGDETAEAGVNFGAGHRAHFGSSINAPHRLRGSGKPLA